MTSNDEYVLQLLTERGYLLPEQVEAAAQSMKAENETTLDVLVSGGTLDEDTVLGTIADQFGLKYCHINADAIADTATAAVPADIARKYGALGWKVNGAGGDGGSVTILSSPSRTRQREMLAEINAFGDDVRVIETYLSRFGLRVWESH